MEDAKLATGTNYENGAFRTACWEESYALTVSTPFNPSASRKLMAFKSPVRVLTRTGVMTLAA